MKKNIRILSICGSLRPNSSNHSIVNAIAGLMPEYVDFLRYNGLATLPAFDDSIDQSPAVINFRRQLSNADGILICTPEYAFGVPGSLKNALDWTVGTGEFVDKPVALVVASTGGENAYASLLLTLKALSARMEKDGSALISYVRSKLDNKGNVSDPETLKILQTVIDRLLVNMHDKLKTETEELETRK
ncbi:MAG: NAD(P)H-dependent oxidoreductase [Bacteroidetes bacterium]|nr:NAD(P)H-dependent oxidoreductase [Bacteroidota bacterium]